MALIHVCMDYWEVLFPALKITTEIIPEPENLSVLNISSLKIKLDIGVLKEYDWQLIA